MIIDHSWHESIGQLVKVEHVPAGAQRPRGRINCKNVVIDKMYPRGHTPQVSTGEYK